MQLGGAAGGGSAPTRKKKPTSSLTKPNRRDPNGNSLPPRRTPTSSVNYTGGSIRSNSSGSYGNVPTGGPGGGGSGGGGLGGGPAPHAVPDINSYLGGDTSYQQQLRRLAQAMNNFNADVTRRKGVLTSEYGVSKKALGDQRTMDLDALEDDYGARGLIRSGLYGDAVGDYEKEFGLRMGDLDRRQQQALQQLLQEQSAFGNQNTLSKQAAREAAIRRRAEQYGV